MLSEESLEVVKGGCCSFTNSKVHCFDIIGYNVVAMGFLGAMALRAFETVARMTAAIARRQR